MISLVSILPSYQFVRYQAAPDASGGEGKEEIRVGFTQWGGSDSKHTRHSIHGTIKIKHLILGAIWFGITGSSSNNHTRHSISLSQNYEPRY